MTGQVPPRLKRAVSHPTQKGRVVSVISGGGGPRSDNAIPDAGTVATAPKTRDPLAGVGLATALGVKKSAPPGVVGFEREPRADLWAAGVGVRKAPSIVVAYGRADAPESVIEAFAKAGAHEFRREGRQGRNVLRAVLNGLNKGDTIMLATLGDLAIPQDLPKLTKEIEARGVRIQCLDGADTHTARGREKIATKVLAARQLFGLRI